MGLDRLSRIIALRLRTVFRRNDVERELDDELQYHVDQQIAEHVRNGMSPHDARATALRAIGGLEFRKDQVRDTRGTRWLDELSSDFSFALRSVRRARGFATAVIVTLALGIGANTAMFTLLRGTLLRPLPNREGNRLIYLRQSAPGSGQTNISFSVPEVADFRAEAKTLSSIAEYSQSIPFTLVAADGHPTRARVGIISGNYFEVLGLSAVEGRLTSPRDDGPDAPSVAVLSYKYWLEHFGGDPKVIGRVVRLNDQSSTIIGVTQPAPDYPRLTEIFVNTVTSPHHLSATMVTGRTHRMSELFARLAPNATVEQAKAEIEGISAGMFRDHPEAYEKAAKHSIAVFSLREALSERASMTFWLLMGAATFVLLIACANVAYLTLMRGIGREREMVVRAALGAGRARLRRLLVVENLTLAIVGGALGVLVAAAALRLLVAFAAQFSPRASEIRIDATVLAVGLATSVLAAILLSFIPRISNDGVLGSALGASNGGRRVTLGHGRQRVQQTLVVAQIAVCMILLTGAGLLTRTLTKLHSVETGVQTDRVLTLDLPLQGDLLKEVMKPEHLDRYERIRSRVAALPGVDVASLGSAVPLRGSLDFDVKAENRATPPNRATPHASVKMVDPKYFAASGIPVIKGRTFETTDRRGSALVVIVSQAFAKQIFGDEDPVGKRIAWTGDVLRFTPFSGSWRTIVGIVGDTRDRGLDGDLTPSVYEPFAQELVLGGSLVIRTSTDPAAMQQNILRAIHDEAPTQLIEHVATFDQIRDEAVAPRRLNAMFISSFGGLAFVIAMVGIAGVLAFAVTSRTSEIGIRMSLGADAARVRRMILGEGGLLLAVGVALGLTGALFAARLLRGMLFGVSPHDPLTLASVTFVLAAVGVAACWLPAARAARVDPAIALRAE
jgi:putative ABC transport system permease protein